VEILYIIIGPERRECNICEVCGVREKPAEAVTAIPVLYKITALK